MIPRGVRELADELFCTDEEQGRELLDAAAAITPIGPLQLMEASGDAANRYARSLGLPQ